MNDVADHCTVCHKCESPCPVNIDFGEVTAKMRKILVDRGQKRRNLGTAAALAFLNTTDPTTIRGLRTGLASWGFKGINAGHAAARRLGLLGGEDRTPAATGGKLSPIDQIVELVRRPIRVEVPKRTFRSLLELEDRTQVPILRNPGRRDEDADAVFYFPGCGSERLFSDVSLATLAMLCETGAQTILPPGYLCCGYPQTSAGFAAKGHRSPPRTGCCFTASPPP